MINPQDEAQAKEFLKRIEIITMKKDLRKLREADAIKEKSKIVSGGFKKTFGFAQDGSTPNKAVPEELKEIKEKFEREKILNENYIQEIEAEKQLKNYANEEEKQRIFILESQKIELEKKRWEVEREISKEDSSIEIVNQDYKKIINEENDLKQRITDIDKQLRQIYSQIVQRIQWARSPSTRYSEKEYLRTIPDKVKENLEKQAEAEEEHRRKFLENIETKAKQ